MSDSTRYVQLYTPHIYIMCCNIRYQVGEEEAGQGVEPTAPSKVNGPD